MDFIWLFLIIRVILQCVFVLMVIIYCFFLINGIFVSDYYLSNNFERYFTSKFMEYNKIDHPVFRNRI